MDKTNKCVDDCFKFRVFYCGNGYGIFTLIETPKYLIVNDFGYPKSKVLSNLSKNHLSTLFSNGKKDVLFVISHPHADHVEEGCFDILQNWSKNRVKIFFPMFDIFEKIGFDKISQISGPFMEPVRELYQRVRNDIEKSKLISLYPKIINVNTKKNENMKMKEIGTEVQKVGEFGGGIQILRFKEELFEIYFFVPSEKNLENGGNMLLKENMDTPNRHVFINETSTISFYLFHSTGNSIIFNKDETDFVIVHPGDQKSEVVCECIQYCQREKIIEKSRKLDIYVVPHHGSSKYNNLIPAAANYVVSGNTTFPNSGKLEKSERENAAKKTQDELIENIALENHLSNVCFTYYHGGVKENQFKEKILDGKIDLFKLNSEKHYFLFEIGEKMKFTRFEFT